MGRPRTSTQYAVVYFPGQDQHINSAVGPFYSQEKAYKAADRISALDPEDGSANATPQVVELITLDEALDEMLFGERPGD